MDLRDDKVYSMAANAYLASGGDGFFMLVRAAERRDTYLSLKSLVGSVLADGHLPKAKVEGR